MPSWGILALKITVSNSDVIWYPVFYLATLKSLW